MDRSGTAEYPLTHPHKHNTILESPFFLYNTSHSTNARLGLKHKAKQHRDFIPESGHKTPTSIFRFGTWSRMVMVWHGTARRGFHWGKDISGIGEALLGVFCFGFNRSYMTYIQDIHTYSWEGLDQWFSLLTRDSS
jgi:hypothetical protein